MMKTLLSLCVSISPSGTLCAAPPETSANNLADDNRHVIVVGTGMAGLSAALEAAQNGATVTVLEMWSVFGGTSFISGGKLAIVGTALQESKGINDSPDLAFQDFINCGKDLDQEWVRQDRTQVDSIIGYLASRGHGLRDLVELVVFTKSLHDKLPSLRTRELIWRIFTACELSYRRTSNSI